MMRLGDDFRPVKLDFDALYAEAEAEGREGICPMCEFDDDTTPRMLCWCGVCFKYHHDDYAHEPIDDFDPFGDDALSGLLTNHPT
jgi:hypothetical protein